MKTLHINLPKTLLENEKALLNVDIRKDPEKILDYVTSDFTEICSSGKLYVYKPGDTISKPGDQQLQYEILDFHTSVLSNECMHATYKLIQRYENGSRRETLRSSIWTRVEDNWKMKFHQGTLVNVIEG